MNLVANTLSQLKRAWRPCLSGLLFSTFASTLPAQTLTTLFSFDGADGQFPVAALLVQSTNGEFYGAASQGGADTFYGTIFRVNASGELTKLYTFCAQTDCADGYHPSGLVQATNGNFYGTTESDTVFEMTPGGTLTTLYTFCSLAGCADGNTPQAALVQAANSELYGSTYYGGTGGANCAIGCGTIFKMTPSGNLTTLYRFCSQPECADGAYPTGGLVQAANGDLYGVTANGGMAGVDCVEGCGTIFKITPAGRPNDAVQFLRAKRLSRRRLPIRADG